VDLAGARFRYGFWTSRQTFRKPRYAGAIERAYLVLVKDLFKVEAVVSAYFRVAVLAIVTAEDCVVQIANVVARVSGREAVLLEDD
jgi:hypothetical protein